MLLYQHQREIIAEDRKKTGIWLGTGSGKTLIACCLAKKRTLVITPKTQKEDQNWEREVFKNRIALNLTVVSKEWFRDHWDELPYFDTLIGEEAHTLLGVTPFTRQRDKVLIPKTSQVYEALMAYIAKWNPERVYLLSATIGKSPMTVWGAAQALGHRDGEGNLWDWFEFRDRFYKRRPMGTHDIWTAKTDSKTKDLLASLIRKLGYVGRLDDYFDVPEQIYRTVHIELTGKQEKRIKGLRLEYPDPIVRIGKEHQVENGVLSANEFNAEEIFENGKTEKILELAEEFPRMVVFAKYTLQIKNIQYELVNAGHKVFVLDGNTKNKGKVLEEAKKCDSYVLIAQAQVSAGWELPDCPTMVFVSRTYSWVDYDQALGRIQRANNIKKNVYINLVVKGGTDEAVHECLEGKKDFNERIYAEQI